jgi:hypothetical protein
MGYWAALRTDMLEFFKEMLSTTLSVILISTPASGIISPDGIKMIFDVELHFSGDLAIFGGILVE